MGSSLDPTVDRLQASDQQPSTTSSRISFGVELEFVVAWVYEDEADPDEGIASELAPLLRIPKESYDTRGFVKKKVSETLAKAGLPCRPSATDVYHPDSIQKRQALCDEFDYTAFQLKTDASIKEFRGMDGYHVEGLELVSPAMFNRANSFDLIRLAVCTLTSQFRCRVNQSCGFHVHVGVGRRKRIDPRTLRHFGALVWAASPILSQLHAPDRAVQGWSESIRECLRSHISSADATVASLWRNAWLYNDLQREGFKGFARAGGRDRWLGETYEPEDEEEARDHTAVADMLSMGEPGRHWQDGIYMAPEATDAGPISRHDAPNIEQNPSNIEHNPPNINYDTLTASLPATSPETPNDKTAPPRPRHPPFKRSIPHIALRPPPQRNPDIIARAQPWTDEFHLQSPQQVERATRRDVFSGVREVLAADFAGGLVGQIFSGTTKHTAYNFDNYSLDRYEELEIDGPTTIELREAGPSLDVDWICTWAKIACRLLEWSRDACDADFFRVVRLLAWAQEEGGQYDVIDFLVDLNLLTEARFCEDRVKRGAEAWFECLLFAPTTSRGREQEEEARRREWEGEEMALG
ncbi:hypothetical protein ACHAQA_004250 [Verticillium albo-atrum]